MSRIKTADQLLLFLEVLAKESVAKAKDDIKESIDIETEYFARGLSKQSSDKRNQRYSKFMPIIETGEEEDETDQKEKPKKDSSSDDFGDDEGFEKSDDKDKSSKEDKDTKSSKFGGKQEITIPLVDNDPSLDELIKGIGWIRAGASIKGDIKIELNRYFEKLGEPERKALYTMLASIASIMNEEIDGSEAQDPSDDPLNLIIDDPEEEKDNEPEAAQSPSGEAPIKVGNSTSMNESSFRRKVRALMNK